MRSLDASGVFWLGRPDPARLDRLLVSQRDTEPTHRPTGATLGGRLPAGFYHGHRHRTIGSGEEDFAAAARGLRGWAPQSGAGLLVHPAGAPVREGQDVVVVATLAGVTVTACCRVVAVIDEPDRSGFVYSTLPAHPEVGEELFMVEREADGKVVCRVSVFWRSRHPLVRAVNPVMRVVQRQTVKRYVRAVETVVAAARGTG